MIKCIFYITVLLLCICGCSNRNLTVDDTQYTDKNNIVIIDFDEDLGIGINDNNFNDPILKEYIKKYCDIDSNDYLSKEETDKVVKFPFSIKHKSYFGISNLDGLKFFPNLEVIDLYGEYFEGLSNLDLSNLIKLKELRLWNTNIKNLNIDSNINLNQIVITNPLFCIMKIPNILNDVSISIHDVLAIESFNLDISDCSYFDDYNNIINDIDIENRSSNENGIIRVIKNNDLVKYSNGRPSNEHIDSDNNYSFIIRPSVYIKGQGFDNISNDTRFAKYQDALDYGLSGNMWFYIDSIVLNDSTDCLICGDPECKILCDSNGFSSVKLVYQDLIIYP